MRPGTTPHQVEPILKGLKLLVTLGPTAHLDVKQSRVARSSGLSLSQTPERPINRDGNAFSDFSYRVLIRYSNYNLSESYIKSLKMNRLPHHFLPVQSQKKPDAISATSDGWALEVAQLEALHHIHDAAEVLTNAMPHVGNLDRQLYASMIGGLRNLERHLTGLHQT